MNKAAYERMRPQVNIGTIGHTVVREPMQIEMLKTPDVETMERAEQMRLEMLEKLKAAYL